MSSGGGYTYSPSASGSMVGPIGVSGTGSMGMPTATSNGTFATPSPSVIPYTGAAAKVYDLKLFLSTFIGLTVAVLLL